MFNKCLEKKLSMTPNKAFEISFTFLIEERPQGNILILLCLTFPYSGWIFRWMWIFQFRTQLWNRIRQKKILFPIIYWYKTCVICKIVSRQNFFLELSLMLTSAKITKFISCIKQITEWHLYSKLMSVITFSTPKDFRRKGFLNHH